MSKILDGKIHALNSQWAYIGIEYACEYDGSVVFVDIYHMMKKHTEYMKHMPFPATLEEFSIIKYPAFELDDEKHNSFLMMKFKRIPGDGLSE